MGAFDKKKKNQKKKKKQDRRRTQKRHSVTRCARKGHHSLPSPRTISGCEDDNKKEKGKKKCELEVVIVDKGCRSRSPCSCSCTPSDESCPCADISTTAASTASSCDSTSCKCSHSTPSTCDGTSSSFSSDSCSWSSSSSSSSGCSRKRHPHRIRVRERYAQTNLVSDIAGVARFTDPNLVNPWGIASAGRAGPWWVADNGAGVATVYNGDGIAQPPENPRVVVIPAPVAGEISAPTGIVFNELAERNPGDFVISLGARFAPAVFLFATENGTIAGWSPLVSQTQAVQVVNNSGLLPPAIYKGIALATGRSGARFLYATNFQTGRVEIFDNRFNFLSSFTDPALAATCPMANQCFAPFGIRNIGGLLYVTFALQDAEHEDDVPGPGNGFVSVFAPDGRLIRRLISGGALNAPWGLAVAPREFLSLARDAKGKGQVEEKGRKGKTDGDDERGCEKEKRRGADEKKAVLLVGNFGDGRINAYRLRTGRFLGPLLNAKGVPLVFDGLWGIAFGNDGQAGPADTLFLAAGIADEAHGLFARLRHIAREKDDGKEDGEDEKRSEAEKNEDSTQSCRTISADAKTDGNDAGAQHAHRKRDHRAQHCSDSDSADGRFHF